MDIPGTSTAPSPEDDAHLTGDKRSLSSRCVSGSSTAPDMEYGLGLLASGSPIGEHREVDDKLLDYDSDKNATQQQLALKCPADRSAMETESHSQKNTAVQIDSNVSNVIPDAMYHQCRASRISVHRDNLVSISPDSTFGKRIVSQSIPVGSFEDHSGIEKTFHGSRILKGNATVNQSLSSSFDPSNLICVSCQNEHEIVGVKPISVCFTDQNFVTSVASKDGGCVNVVRIENPSLLELLDTGKEIFANVRIPEGSVFLFGSASHLSRFGTSLYARDWTTLVAGVSTSWLVCTSAPSFLLLCPNAPDL
jgi:hypothetical protein